MTREPVLNDIRNKYERFIKKWDDNRLLLELSIVDRLFQTYRVNEEEAEWYSLCYNYLEEELIRRGELND